MHHPEFYKCSIRFYRSPISIGVHFGSPYSHELFGFSLRVSIPELSIDIPYTIIEAFVRAKAAEGEVINYSIFDDIPF
jgi:hypothetical protein